MTSRDGREHVNAFVERRIEISPQPPGVNLCSGVDQRGDDGNMIREDAGEQ